MAFDYDASLKRIIAKATLLEERYQRLAQKCESACAEVDELKKQLAERDQLIEQLRIQVEYLQLASTIAPTRDQAETARALITSLVRDIDRCITDLSD